MFQHLEPLRFVHEAEILGAVTSRIGSLPVLDGVQARHLLGTRRRDLLGDAVRVTADLLPELHAVYQSCLDAIGGGLSGELFVTQSPTYNASVFASETTFDILIHSALIRDFSPDELRFVFGHELGHVVFGHSRYPVRDILEQLQERDPVAALFLVKWGRATEVSADRLGLLCCGQMLPTATALFKTASGLPGADPDRVLRSLRGQFEELRNQLASLSEAPTWVRTHPMIPIRFKALELAALDIISLRREATAFSQRGFRQVDRQIGEILGALDALQ